MVSDYREFLAGLVQVLAALHVEILQTELLAVPADDQVEVAGLVAAQQQGHVAEGVDALPVDGQDAVAHLKAGGGFQRAAVGEAVDHRDVDGLDPGVKHQNDDKAREEVHQGAGGKDQELAPEALVIQGSGVVGVLLLPFHGAEAADGQQAQSICGIAPGLFEQGGAHADGELVDPHAAGLGRQKVAQLVDGDEHAEYQDRS